MAVDRQGRLYVWGKSDARLGLGSVTASTGTIGDGGVSCISIPKLHTMLETKSFMESQAVSSDGMEKEEGGGGGVVAEIAGSPARTRIVQCCAAFEHSMVMTSTGRVLTFGYGTSGKLGIATNLLRGEGGSLSAHMSWNTPCTPHIRTRMRSSILNINVRSQFEASHARHVGGKLGAKGVATKARFERSERFKEFTQIGQVLGPRCRDV